MDVMYEMGHSSFIGEIIVFKVDQLVTRGDKVGIYLHCHLRLVIVYFRE